MEGSTACLRVPLHVEARASNAPIPQNPYVKLKRHNPRASSRSEVKESPKKPPDQWPNLPLILTGVGGRTTMTPQASAILVKAEPDTLSRFALGSGVDESDGRGRFVNIVLLG